MFFSHSEYCNSLTWGIYTLSSFRNANTFQVKDSLARVWFLRVECIHQRMWDTFYNHSAYMKKNICNMLRIQHSISGVPGSLYNLTKSVPHPLLHTPVSVLVQSREIPSFCNKIMEFTDGIKQMCCVWPQCEPILWAINLYFPRVRACHVRTT